MKKKFTIFIACLCICISSFAKAPDHLTFNPTVHVPDDPGALSRYAFDLTIIKTSDYPVYPTSATSIFTITISNPASFPVTIDRITDEIPDGFIYQGLYTGSEVTISNSLSVPPNGATGTITFQGGANSAGPVSYLIPAGGSFVLKYSAITRSTPAFNLLTTVRYYVGPAELGAAQNTVSVSTTLPVSLLSFNAAWQNEMIKLSWTTAAEINSHSTEIERSTGNSGYIKLGEVAAAGTSGSTQTYSFTDLSPAPGNNKYRLKMVDLDGRSVYSPIIALTKKVSGFQLISSYPNPFEQELNIQVSADKNHPVELRLTDMAGKIVFRRQQNCVRGVNLFTINEPGLTAGATYLLQVISADGAQAQRVVKSL
jgi:hypothetical protein